MDNFKYIFKNKKVITGIITIVLLVGCISGYFIYDNNRKNEILEKMAITFTETKEIEYGTKDFDVQKELVKEVKDAELTEVPKLDTTKIGEVTLTFTLKKSDVTKTVEHKVKIIDTKGPEIILEAESKELTVGDEYDIKTNVTSVKDVIDGNIALIENANEINKKATEDYKNIAKVDIKDNSQVADKKLNEFLIETVFGEEEAKTETNTLFLKNCYYIDGSVDIATAGEYKITIVAVDKNGIKTAKEFTVTVKEKEVEKSIASNDNGSSSDRNGHASSGGGSTLNGSGNASVSRGSKQDIINTAIAQIGKPYQAGASGPNAFDCSGLIYYAYTQNGWSIPRYPESGGTRISSDQRQPGDIIYLAKGTTGLPHVMLYVGGNQYIDAQTGGVGYGAAIYGWGPNDVFIRY